jgi:two-component sensor histidine kinase
MGGRAEVLRMNQRKRSRQVLLIVIAILLPAAVLVGLARRVVRQERELAKTQAAEERRNALEQLRRELAARLDAVRLREVNRWIRVPSAPDAEQPPDSSLVFVAALDGDRLVLPWEGAPRATDHGPAFVALRRLGESLEFIKKDYAAAAGAYRQARTAASTTADTCEARLFEARSLTKNKQAQQSAIIYRAMLKECDGEVDEDGIPFALYAAERLIGAVRDSTTGYQYVFNRIDSTRWFSPYEGYLLRSLLKPVSHEGADHARQTVESRIAEAQQIAAFAKDLHRVQPLAETGWVAYGPESWLVSIVAAERPLPSLVFAISSVAASQKFISPSATLVARNTPDSEPLGEGFVGFNVKWRMREAGVATGHNSSAYLYTGGIAFILGVTILAGYLLLRDVDRETRLAELRSHFVASVSHELKTPLTAIRMFAETLALGRARDERVRSEYVETILNESERLARLVDNVLDFSKIEQGKKIYRIQPAMLADVVRSAARAMQYPLAQQGFTLNVSIDERVHKLPADIDAMEQAILNLLSNAMKYSGAEREIDLSLKWAGNEAVIEVTDRGVGIDPEEQPRVFEKFYRGRSAAGGMIAGTGLGLTVVQHIAEAHGGRVEVRSAAGKGSTFSIRIPVSPAEVPA